MPHQATPRQRRAAPLRPPAQLWPLCQHLLDSRHCLRPAPQPKSTQVSLQAPRQRSPAQCRQAPVRSPPQPKLGPQLLPPPQCKRPQQLFPAPDRRLSQLQRLLKLPQLHPPRLERSPAQCRQAPVRSPPQPNLGPQLLPPPQCKRPQQLLPAPHRRLSQLQRLLKLPQLHPPRLEVRHPPPKASSPVARWQLVSTALSWHCKLCASNSQSTWECCSLLVLNEFRCVQPQHQPQQPLRSQAVLELQPPPCQHLLLLIVQPLHC